MSLYDEENPLLWSPKPFWAQEPDVAVAAPPAAPPVAPVPVAPPAAPELPEVEGEGYASLEEIGQPVLPEVEGKGYASLEEIGPAVDLPEVEGPGYASLEEIGKPVELEPSLAEKLVKSVEQAEPIPTSTASPLISAVPGLETVLKAGDLVSRGANALRRGWLGGDVAMEMQKGAPSLDYIAQQQKLADSLKPSKDAQIVMDDKASGWDSVKALARDPLGIITDMLGESFGTQFRTGKEYAHKIPERVAEFTAGGAIVGSPGGLPGAVAGGTVGAEAGLALGMSEMAYASSKSAEYSSSIVQSLQESGVNPHDPEQLKRAFSDPALMAKIRDKAEKKAVPVALLDGLSVAIGGRIFTAPAKTVGKKLLKWGGELAVQAGLGMGGEAGGQKLSEGKITSWRSIMAEGLLEPAGSIHEIATGSAFQPEVTATTVASPAAPPLAPGPVAGTVPPEAAIPPIVPPAVPGVTIMPAPGEVPVPPDLAAPPVAAAPAVPPVAEAVPPVPPIAPPPAVPAAPEIEPGPPTPAGAAVTQHVGTENIAVTQEAAKQAQNLQAAGAPQTAQAIQQVAKASNAGATVSAAEFLAQAKAKAAEEEAKAAAKAAPEAPAAAVPGAVQPGEFAQPGYTAVAPAPAEAPAAAVAQAPVQPTGPTPAVVVGGQIFTGQTPAQARSAAQRAVGPDAITTAVTGWVDPETGRFASHEIYDVHRAFEAAREQSGGDMAHPAVQQAGAALAEAQAREDELNSQIVSPGGEQVVQTGVKGQEALVAVRPSQELAVPLAGVNVAVEAVTPAGQTVSVQRPAAQALNESRNDRTALTILLDCLH